MWSTFSPCKSRCPASVPRALMQCSQQGWPEMCKLVAGNLLWCGHLRFLQLLGECSGFGMDVIVIGEKHWSWSGQWRSWDGCSVSHCVFNGRDPGQASLDLSPTTHTLQPCLLRCRRYAAVRCHFPLPQNRPLPRQRKPSKSRNTLRRPKWLSGVLAALTFKCDWVSFS